MDAVLHALTDPHRRVILEELSRGEATAGELGELVPISQPGVSRHLAVLRDAGLVEVRPEGQLRVYRLRPEALEPVGDWLEDRRRMWQQRLGALHTEVARGRRQRRRPGGAAPTDTPLTNPASNPASAAAPSTTEPITTRRKEAR